MGEQRVMIDRWYRLRFEVLKRDNFACQYCGQYAPNVILHVVHKVAWVDGGDDSLDNLIACCEACNLGKEHLRKKCVRQRGTLADKIVALLEQRGPLGRQELSQLVGITTNHASRLLSQLKDEQRVVHKGLGAWESADADVV